MNTLIKDRTNFIYTFLLAPREISSRCDAKGRSCALEWPLLASPMLYRQFVPRALPGASYFAPSGLESASRRTNSAGRRTGSGVFLSFILYPLSFNLVIRNPSGAGQVLKSGIQLLYPCISFSKLHLPLSSPFYRFLSTNLTELLHFSLSLSYLYVEKYLNDLNIGYLITN